MTYPMTPEDGFDEDDDNFDDDVLERVQQLAKDNPIPDQLRMQIMNWIEPQTVHTETDHADVMDAIEIAYPLIVAWVAERHAAELKQAQFDLSNSYRERAQLLGLAAVNYPALITEATDIPCDHRTCNGRHWHLLVVTIDGHQATWHIHPDDMGLWSHVPYVPPDDPRVQWDGHTTEQKYERILDYTARCESPSLADAA